MPDGSGRKAKSWETSPMDVAKEVSKSLSERIVIAKVHPFYASSTLPFIFKTYIFYFFYQGGRCAVGFGTTTRKILQTRVTGF